MTAWLLYLTLLGLHVSGLALNLIGLPGLWLMVAAHAGYGWATGWDVVGWQSSLAMLLLAVLAEIVEFAAGAAGSKAAGGSLRSTVGALVGGVIGGIAGVIVVPVLPVVNAVLGACVGSFVGAAVCEASKVVDDAEGGSAYYARLRRVGWGAFTGRFWGTVLKSLVGVVMLAVSLVTAWS